MKVNGEKSCWAAEHHMTDVEIVVPRFGHYVKLASTLGALPGGAWGKYSITEKQAWLYTLNSMVDSYVLLGFHWFKIRVVYKGSLVVPNLALHLNSLEVSVSTCPQTNLSCHKVSAHYMRESTK